MPTTAENKVKYGITNVHVAIATETVDETTGVTSYTYGTPHRIPGAVSLSLQSQGGLTPFYADNMSYYVTYADNGYSGDLTLARITDWFRANVLKERQYNDSSAGGTSAAHVELSDEIPAAFALLFEFDGDRQKRRHVLYNCTVSRPGLTGETTTDTVTPNTDTITLTASPREDRVVKAWAGPDDSAFANWYTSVWQPST